MYSTVLKHGDDVILDAVIKLFREADLHEEKVRLMRCMGAVSQPELIKKVLDFSLTVSFTVEPVLSLMHVDRLIQVVQNTGRNTVKMPFYITVNDEVYSLCIKALKNSLG